MTKPSHHMPLFPDEDAIALEVMGPRRAKDWPAKARYLEDKHGLPAIDPLMGARFWPAVEDFFRVRYGVKAAGALDGGEEVAPSSTKTGGIRIVPYKADGKEQYDGPEAYPAIGRRVRGRDNR